MRLSIVVNMYNTAAYLPRCMDTLLHQDIPTDDYEIILVDDCSTDNSLELANDYAARYPNIHVCVHTVNKGLAAARNTGIDVARGQYLCFVDPDDYIEKNSLAPLLLQMDREQLDMLRFNYQKVDEQYNYIADSEKEAIFDYSPCVMTGADFLAQRLGVECYVWAYVYRLDFLRSTGLRFFEGCFFDDTPWLPRILQKAQRINTTNVRHQYYLQRSSSMVHSRNREATLRRANMHMQLVDILSEQRAEAPIETYEWYDMMLAHAAVSLLTAVASIDYHLSQEYHNKLRDKGIFPLSTVRTSRKKLRKIILLNICPSMFSFLVYSMNKRSRHKPL